MSFNINRLVRVCILSTAAGVAVTGHATASECASLSIPAGEIIWCDSFEDDTLPPSGNVRDNYFDYSDQSGGQRQGRSSNEAYDGTYSLRHAWLGGGTDTGPGWLYRTFGRSPLTSQSHSQRDFREIYWRFFVKYPAGTQSFPNKVSRGMIYASSNWAQAMIAHLWLVDTGSRYLRIDPTSGTSPSGALVSTRYNDPNLRWLGGINSPVPVSVGSWQCHEVHVKLNSAGAADGEFQLWLDGTLVASRNDLNWVGAYNAYGLNAVMLETYWNGGAPQATERYIDNFVIATGLIGCSVAPVRRPMPPTQVAAN